MEQKEAAQTNPVEVFAREVQEACETLLKTNTPRESNSPCVRAKKLRLKAIRRYKDPAVLDLSNDFTLIYAENGVGKSTLAEALELIQSGETSRPEFTGLKNETKLQDSLPSWGMKESDLEVTLEFQDGHQDTFKFDGVSDNPRSTFKTVSRSNVRQRVTSGTNDRYTTLLQIANIEEAIPVFERLTDLQNLAKKHLDSLKIDRNNFGKALESAGISKEISKLDPSFMTSGNDDLEQELDRAYKRKSQLSEAQRSLQSAKGKCDPLLLPPPLEYVEEPKESGKGLSLTILRELKSILSPDEKCPVCKTGLVTSDRLSEISQTLDDEASLLEARARYESFLTKLDERSNAVAEFKTSMANLDHVRKKALSLLNQETNLHTTAEGQTGHPTTEVANLATLSTMELCLDTEQRLENAIGEISKEIEDLQSQDILKKRIAWEQLGNDEASRRSRLSTYQLYPTLLSDFESTKETLSDLKDRVLLQKIQPIQESIEKWWSLMAPGHTNFDLKVNVKTGLAKPKVEFLCVLAAEDGTQKRTEKHALGHMSDSQLDLLSLAIEFAGHSANDGLLWLDDPTDMLDDQTRKSFCIKALPALIDQGVQVALATHSRAIVHHCWEAAYLAEGGGFGDSFRQVNIEVLTPEAGTYPTARFAPSDIVSARRNVAAIKREIQDGRKQWSLASRSMYTNQLRRYAEFALSSSIDLLLQITNGAPYQSGLSLGDNTSTLDTYRTQLIQIQDFLRRIIMPHASTGLQQNMQHSFDRLVSTSLQISNSILNEGSHASTSVPTFTELEEIHSTIDQMWPEDNEITVDHLIAPHYFKDLVGDGSLVEEWDKILTEVRQENIRIASKMIEHLKAKLEEEQVTDRQEA
ncbi:hypothetical protein HMPREF3048_08580 [Corynebacterium sp. HMSC075D04]|uniref:AAA family ATPase n=1 Tax=Corynebacterium sp. HMSC075D04 TaxID=1739540 RepID=UPI0008A2B4B8|nr:AAA family ATPase [Corynebacterium sp. HMSC075D04]OFO34524.1 hypothetical protein HMPREF3048_08580 [Corynebacterium sp. HMSC075D04]